jgi:carbamoyl-phosphate synthase small subunit
MKGKLVLADGSVFFGELLQEMTGSGEVVFNTGMTGYQEILTDPSYCGQIVCLTYPLVGNYGIAGAFEQSRRSFVRGFVISELCDTPNNWQCQQTLPEYLRERQIPCIYGVDTRAITRKIRAYGTMKGMIATADTTDEVVRKTLAMPTSSEEVREVTTPGIYRIENTGPKVVVMDFGIKQNIVRSMQRLGCDLTVVPADTDADDIVRMNPDGVFLSNGPGDPKEVIAAITTIKSLLGKFPIFGICLGHQLLALALGADTYKMKFGHRGSNHPVKNLLSGKVHITSQNHGYAVDEKSLNGLDLVITHRAVNDGTVEGLRHKYLPVFSVQYHPEAAPGPDDNVYLFDEFMALLNGGR